MGPAEAGPRRGLDVSRALRPIFCGTVVVALAATSTPASAAGLSPYRLKAGAKCKVGYVRQVRRVKQREHGRTVRVREVWCLIRTTTGVHVSTGTTSTGIYSTISSGVFYEGQTKQFIGPTIKYRIVDLE